jgi:hypothetical protein
LGADHEVGHVVGLARRLHGDAAVVVGRRGEDGVGDRVHGEGLVFIKISSKPGSRQKELSAGRAQKTAIRQPSAVGRSKKKSPGHPGLFFSNQA